MYVNMIVIFFGAKNTTRNSWRVNLISQSLNFIDCSKVLFSNHFSSDDTSHTRRFFPLTEIDSTSRSSILYFSLTSVIYHHTPHVSIGIRIILSTALLIFRIKAHSQTIFDGQTGWSQDWRKVSECDVRFIWDFTSSFSRTSFYLLSRTCIGLGLKVALEDDQLLNNNQVYQNMLWNVYSGGSLWNVQGGTIIVLTDGEQTSGCLAIEDMIDPLVRQRITL